MVLSEKYPSIFPLFCRTRSNAFCHSHLGTFSLSIRTQVQFPVTFNCWRAPIAIMVSANDSVAVRRRTGLVSVSPLSFVLFNNLVCLLHSVMSEQASCYHGHTTDDIIRSSSSCHNNEVLLNITTFLKKRLFVAFSSSSFCCCCVVLLFHYYIVTITLLQSIIIITTTTLFIFFVVLSGGADSVSE